MLPPTYTGTARTVRAATAVIHNNVMNKSLHLHRHGANRAGCNTGTSRPSGSFTLGGVVFEIPRTRASPLPRLARADSHSYPRNAPPRSAHLSGTGKPGETNEKIAAPTRIATLTTVAWIGSKKLNVQPF